MKLLLFAAFLTAFCLFEAAHAYVVIDPYSVSEEMIIANPVFDDFFMQELVSNQVLPVFKDGSVDFYIADESSCFFNDGNACVAIPCGNIICGSNRFQADDYTPGTIIDDGLISGNSELHDMAIAVDTLRYSAIENPEHLSMVENKILEIDGSEADKIYVENRYDSSISNLINDELSGTEEFSKIQELLDQQRTTEAIAALDEYFTQNYDISSVYDTADLYTAMKNKQIGPMQYSAILNTLLNEYGEGPQSMDYLMNHSDILNSTFGSDLINQTLEEIAKNPELLKELQDSMDSMDDELFQELMSKALEECFKNKELMKKYLEMLPDLLKDEAIREMLIKSAADALRQMHESGELGGLMDNINSPELQEQVLDQAKDAAPSIFEKISEAIKSRVNMNYILPLLGLIALIFISVRSKV